MAQHDVPPGTPDPAYRVNPFRPRPGFMRQEVRVIWLMLAGWALLTFGFQVLLALGGETGALTDATLFGFPLPYWFTGQFLIVWFILLCFLFNLFIDRLTGKHRKRK